MDAQAINALIQQFYAANDPAQKLDAAHALVEQGATLSGHFFHKVAEILSDPQPDYDPKKAMTLNLACTNHRPPPSSDAPFLAGPCS